MDNTTADGFTEVDYSTPVSQERADKRDWLILGGVALLLATLLRVVRVGYREYFTSEFITLDTVTEGSSQHWFAGYLEGSRSLYNLLISPWINGIGFLNEGVARVPSLILGIATCLAFFYFARSYLRGIALVICVLAYAMNPILVANSITVGPFALLALCAVLAHHFFIRSLDKEGVLNWTVYAAAMVVGILTHPVMWFLVPAHLLFGLFRGNRLPRKFTYFAIAGLAAAVIFAVVATAYAERAFPDNLHISSPSLSDLARGLVGAVMGDFVRYEEDANSFIRGVMYVFVLGAICLSVRYYRNRTAEALAMPENVIWIDETQDVIGTWKNLSLRSFLLINWFAFLVPVLGLFLLGGFVQGLSLSPSFFVIILPPLVVLIAMGLDAVPREASVALGVLLVLTMAFYDFRALDDKGYGVYDGFARIERKGFNPTTDLVLINVPKRIARSIEFYHRDIPTSSISGFDTVEEYNLRQRELEEMVADRDRIFIIYHDDYRNLGKTEMRSPVREWFHMNTDVFEPEGRTARLSKEDGTEMRIYKRIPPGGLPAEEQQAPPEAEEPTT